MLLTQLYSIFERYSISYAELISEKNNLLSISDLKGSKNYTAIHTFYTKVIDVKFDKWFELDELRHVRNLIAHSDGFIEFSENPNKIKSIIKSNDNLILLDEKRLGLNAKFVKNSIKYVWEFFDLVEPLVKKQDHMLNFSWSILNEFHDFDLI